MTQSEPIKLNIGAGDTAIPGHTPIDLKIDGTDAGKLPYADGTVDEVYASHVLEHIHYEKCVDVLKEWHRVLKPGGRLRVAVPDLAWIVDKYVKGEFEQPIQGLLAGSVSRPFDEHKAHLDSRTLRYYLDLAGFVGMDTFAPEYDDCSRLECSLNIEAYKPAGTVANGFLGRKIVAVMSAPRLLFLDQVQSIWMQLLEMDIPVVTHTGANWGQCLERGFEQIIGDTPDRKLVTVDGTEADALGVAKRMGAEWIMPLDYDSVASRDQIVRLINLFEANQDKWDAIAPIQVKRECFRPLFWRKDKGDIDITEPIFPADSAHFGCTLIKAETLSRMPHPWFLHVPNAEGRWHEGRMDDDIYFWHKFKDAGGRLGCTSRVHIGHLQLMCSWFRWSGEPFHQYISDWRKNGKPACV